MTEEVAELKARRGRDMLLTGGAGPAAALTELRLIDEHHTAVHPVALGGGRRLFAEPDHRKNLRLVDSRALDGMVVVNHYTLAD
jgi:dihydrofolate reductase